MGEGDNLSVCFSLSSEVAGRVRKLAWRGHPQKEGPCQNYMLGEGRAWRWHPVGLLGIYLALFLEAEWPMTWEILFYFMS